MRIERFLRHVEVIPNGCWLWVGCISRDGYGKCRNGKETLAHRWSFQLFRGELVANLEIDHLCFNRGCVNPNHLDLVTHAENIRRSDYRANNSNKRKTACSRGHLFDEVNTVIERDKFGNFKRRRCRTCVNAMMRRRWQSNRSSVRRQRIANRDRMREKRHLNA